MAKEKFTIFGALRKAVPITSVVPLESLSGYSQVKNILSQSPVGRAIAIGIGLFKKETRKLLLVGAGLVGAEKLVQAQELGQDEKKKDH